MTRDRLGRFAWGSFALVIGWIGWSGQVLTLPAATLFPFVWSKAQTRLQAAVFSGLYFLAASRGLPQGVAVFYEAEIWPGLAHWLIASFCFVLCMRFCGPGGLVGRGRFVIFWPAC